MKNIGEKTTNLFERKKKEVGDLATEKASEAQAYAEEQAKKAGEAIEETKNEASGILSNACKTNSFRLFAQFLWNQLNQWLSSRRTHLLQIEINDR